MSKIFKKQLLAVTPPETITLKVTLFDAFRQPLANAPFRLTVNGEVRTATSDGSGLVTENSVPLVPSALLEWGTPDAAQQAAGKEFAFRSTIHLEIGQQSRKFRNHQARRRLQNLGYRYMLENMSVAFQVDYAEDGGKWFDQPTFDRITSVHDTATPGPATDSADAVATINVDAQRRGAALPA